MAESEVVGCIHLHSTYSDGSGTVPDLIEAAEQAGLDFLILTDHGGIRTRRLGLEGWYGKTLLVIGEEVGRKKGHLIAVNVHKAVHSSSTEMVDYIRHANAQDGLSFIVHPDGKPKPSFGIGDARWKVRGHLGFTGMEIWSYMYDWIDSVRWWNFPFKLMRPNSALRGPHPGTLKTWDMLLGNHQKVVGYGGVDAHAKIIFPGLRVFPYQKMFRTIRNHVILDQSFTGNSFDDIKILLDAIRRGRLFFSMDEPDQAFGFRFSARYEENTYSMGDTLKISQGSVLFSVICPGEAEFRLLRNGTCCHSDTGTAMKYETNLPGVYRVELLNRQGRPWIYANPIFMDRSMSYSE